MRRALSAIAIAGGLFGAALATGAQATPLASSSVVAAQSAGLAVTQVRMTKKQKMMMMRKKKMMMMRKKRMMNRM